MAAPSTTDQLIDLVNKSDLIPPGKFDEFLTRHDGQKTAMATPMKLAQTLVIDGLLTKYQAEQLLMGRWRNFVIGGKYKLLERIGKGGMAMVFLCEHQVMKRLVALKILPTAHGEDRELLGRFHREARALSQLRHPNIVGAYDVDQANKTHFLVMEYIDGGDLDQIVHRTGPLAIDRAAHYIRQAAHGLQHAHESGLVHRDIKPGNLLVDRAGTVKLLDLGLARIFHETTDDLTTGRDAAILLGTVDYLAPEQAINSHDVDIRADIYGLGATFYFLLMGKGLFEDGTVTQKLSWHLHRPPLSISATRPEVPAELIAIIEKMLAKKPEDRYQTPEEVYDALEPFTRDPIAAPSPEELPRLSRAARTAGPPSTIQRAASTPRVNPASTTPTPRPAPKPAPISAIAIRRDSPGSAPGPEKVEPIAPAAPPVIEVPAGPEPKPKPKRKRPRVGALVGSLVGLGLIAGGGYYAWNTWGGAVLPFGGGPENPRSSKRLDVIVNEGRGGLHPTAGIGGSNGPPADQLADASIDLVSEKNPAKPFANLREAVKAAHEGDHIVVKGALLRDAVELSEVEHVPRNLTIEGVGGEAEGGLVRWRAPRDLSRGRALLEVAGLEGFTLKGFYLDGQGKVGELVRISGDGQRSKIENCRVRGAIRAGLLLRGWSGEAAKPATIAGLGFETDDETEAAILIEADPDRPSLTNHDIRVTACRFVGPFQSALLLSGTVEGLAIDHCRFLRATDGIRYRRTDERAPARIELANNTFVDLQRGLHFETTPKAVLSEVKASNNLFVGVQRIATLDKVAVLPRQVFGNWIWSDEGRKNSTVPPGDRLFRKTFEVTSVPEKARLDIGCDESYTVWINGEEVGRSPLPYFTQRVYAYDVAPMLRRGRNVIAVKGSNSLDRLDPKFGTSAALMVQLVTKLNNRDVALVKSDETWKFSQDASETWTRPEFDDKEWSPTRVWPETGATWPWMFSVWDAAIRDQIKPPLEPIKTEGKGNVRDYRSWEGYPTIDAERIVVGETILARDPGNDATFLRVPKGHPLTQAGPGQTPVGVLVGD